MHASVCVQKRICSTVGESYNRFSLGLGHGNEVKKNTASFCLNHK